MNYMGGPRKQSRMRASQNDPWVSVGLLAQNVFCQRAGIIHHENPQDVEEEVFHAGRGLQRIFYSFHQLKQSIMLTIMALVIEFILLPVYGFIDTSTLVTQVLSGATLEWLRTSTVFLFPLTIIVIIASFIRLAYLILLYLLAKARFPIEPDPTSSEAQEINWWGLLNAGFQAVKPRDIYRDEQWRLSGCPWRVLIKGNLRIPVFKKRYSEDESGKILHRQHYARMAAYCHLIETNEHTDSPYGVILYGNTHKGITVPYIRNIRNKKTFHAGLLDTRETISKLHQTPYWIPPIPSSTQKCLNCPHSRKDRFSGASPCGTRFGWNPPNNRDMYIYRRW